MVTPGEVTALTVEVSWYSELFESVELYLKGGLKILGHLLGTVGERDYTATSDSYYGLPMYIFVCNLTVGTIMIGLENGL